MFSVGEALVPVWERLRQRKAPSVCRFHSSLKSFLFRSGVSLSTSVLSSLFIELAFDGSDIWWRSVMERWWIQVVKEVLLFPLKIIRNLGDFFF